MMLVETVTKRNERVPRVKADSTVSLILPKAIDSIRFTILSE